MESGQEVGYLEQFALAEDREDVLRQLIPGTEDYYYYHALHYQNTRQTRKLREIVAQWRTRFSDSAGRTRILRREALLNYGKNPAASREHLCRALDLTFPHRRPGQAPGGEVATVLDPEELSWEAFLERALGRANAIERLDEPVLYRLMSEGHEFTAASRRQLLGKLRVPDHPRLVELVLEDLASKESRGFGEFRIHADLTLSQLETIRKKRKGLLRNETFVHAILAKMRPGGDVNLAVDAAAREAYLEQAWQFASNLDPSFNSLKAHLLYHRLVHDRGRGVHDPARFLAYVKLPRAHHFAHGWRAQKGDGLIPVDVSRDYREVTGLPPIREDDPLVRSYLLHLLKDARSTRTYAPYFADDWLNGVFAEAKIVNGLGNPEKWASLLSPAAFQDLQERVDVDFDPTSPEEFQVDEPVTLKLHLKNVETLIVKVFELHPLNYYLDHWREISTDLDLDGLVANHQRTEHFDEPPERRVAHEFDFPEIGDRRGVWIIEFIAGSKSSRAVVRKGTLHVLNETRSGGELITVLDERLAPLSSAGIWFGGRRIACDDHGRALIPFSTDPGTRQAVVESEDGFASLIEFPHPAEQYALTAGIQIEREALRPGSTARVVVRPSLTVAGQPVSLERLEDVQLILTSTDLDGVASIETVRDFGLSSDRESTWEFRVPDHLALLRVELRAKVMVASKGAEELALQSGREFHLNAHLRSDRVDDFFLSRTASGYILEWLGRSGEARGGRMVIVTVRRRGFPDPRRVALKTDETGVIELGPLKGLRSVEASSSDGLDRRWQLPQARRSQPAGIHAVAGEPVHIPHVGGLSREEVAFFALGAGGLTTDTFDCLGLEEGMIVARDLPPGDYRLWLKASGQSVVIRVAQGSRAAGHVINRARVLELPDRKPAHLASLDVKEGSLVVQVANSDGLTRVHVVATRFLPEHDLFGALGNSSRPGLFCGRPARQPNLFASGRRIGDEFRYILERRYARKFPGNLLERPELLLNPWAVRDTEGESEKLAGGEDYLRQAAGEVAAGSRAGTPARKKSEARRESPSSVDFLRHAPAELWNLRPDGEGLLEIDLEALGDRQHVHVLVVDPDGATYRELALPTRETAVRDLRLLTALDPEKHFTEQDAVTFLKEGESLVLPDLFTTRFEVFDHLGAAYHYLRALNPDETFAEFQFLLRWPELPEEEKRALYSRYACHELSFFLSLKDPGFFRGVILPYLANKKNKTFLDEYLLGAKLERYFASFEYSRLNTLERILLARRLPDHLEALRMDLHDRLALRPPDRATESSKFEGALAAFGLDAARGVEARVLEQRMREVDGEAALPAAALRSQLCSLPPVAMADEFDDLGGLPEQAVALREDIEERLGESAFGGRLDAHDDDSVMLADEALYRPLEPTGEWAENNYYQLPVSDHLHDLVPASRFWRDFAEHEGEGPFASGYLGEADHNVHEMLLALAVLDLPFLAPKSTQAIEGRELSFTAGGPALVFHREIREAALADDRPPLLVSQSYFRHGDRHRLEEGERLDKFITEGFESGVVYGGQVVVTNPTSSRQKLDVLIQIPRGAVPVMGHRATVTRPVTLEPYTTESFENYFYFPAAGRFPCYPAHVSKGGLAVAHAAQFEFAVSDQPVSRDDTSWFSLSREGTSEQVLEFLARENLHAIDLEQIAWRCREDSEFFASLLALLDRRGVYHPTIASYALYHDHPAGIREFLLMEGSFLDTCGSYLASKLITIDPVERRAYEHLEYKPLVNHRAHLVGGERRILNGRIRSQYRGFLKILCEKRRLDPADQLNVVYHLFLQDRVGEALDRLELVKPGALPTRLQYDYFQAYGAFYRSEPEEARAIASRYTNHPVDRWRERFAAVVAQADEIAGRAPQGGGENGEQDQEKRADAEPSLDLSVEGSTVRVSFRKMVEVQVNYYEMDLEFLFSSNPFVSSGGKGFSVVRPNRSERLELAADKGEHQFELPSEFQSKNVLVEIVGEGKKRARAVYSNELHTALSERYGMVTVRHEGDGRALPASYVKVYAMTPSGPVFYKDGYTDLRGKFDYASVSTSDIGEVRKFSILVMSDDHGATVLEAPVPQR